MQSRRRSQAAGPRDQPAVAHPVPQRPGPVGGQQRAAHASAPPRPATPRPAPTVTPPTTRPTATTRRQRHRPRPAPAGRHRSVPAQRPGHRVGPGDQFGQHRLARSAAGHGGSSSDASPAPSTPVITASSRAPPNSAHQQRFAQRPAAQPAHVEGVLAHPQQPVLEMQDVGIAAQHQVAEGDQRPQHRQHDRGGQHHQRRRRRRWRRHRSAARHPAPTARQRESCSAAPTPA